MTQKYSTETGTYVLRDSDGYVISKADVPAGEHEVPDKADLSMTADIDAETDLSTLLSESPANLPNPLPIDGAETPSEKLEKVPLDDRHREP